MDEAVSDHRNAVAVSTSQPVASWPSASILAMTTRMAAKRVLLIEDNKDAREMLRMMLELAGHVVYEAADGVAGLALVTAERPDVGIIDIGLPRMDGYQVARRIRDLPHGRDMLLLALTGYGAPADVKRSEEHGFNHHLVKPVDPDYLTQVIHTRVAAR